MTGPPAPAVDVRRSADRFRTRTDWLDSRHSFSFGPHYDPHNTHHGLLVVSNDDVVRPGGGFETHRHRDMEIVTWVLAGSLAHEDSTGRRGVIRPGLAQRMSAGSGIRHAERHDPGPGPEGADDPVHLVQMWVLPDQHGIEPGYEQCDVGSALRDGDLVTLASGMPRHRDHAAVRIHSEHAALHVARLDAPGADGPAGAGEVTLPDAPWLHVYVARGSVRLEGVDLDVGDAARLTAAGARRVTATSRAEVLVWEMHADAATVG